MSVDIQKMHAIKGKAKKRSRKVHKDQTSFSFLAERTEIEAYADAEKEQKIEHKGLLARFKGLRLDWGKISNIDEPIFNFDLKAGERKKYIDMLKRGNSDKDRKALSKMLGLEFSRIYTKYRRNLQAVGGKNPGFQVHPRERRHARKAGELCLKNSITPQTLLEYWDCNIKHFEGLNVTFVPLTFCSSASNVETVVKNGFAKMKAETKLQDGRGHSFSDTSKLEPMIRKKLEFAGHSTIMFNDRHLLSVQRMAKNIADGKNMFIPAELRDMVNWIAKEIFS